jgi:hypothetical protein
MSTWNCTAERGGSYVTRTAFSPPILSAQEEAETPNRIKTGGDWWALVGA